MSKQSRARATSKAASCASPSLQPNTFLVRRGTLLAGGIVMLAAFAVYHNSFSGSFIFDDRLAITENPTIRHLGSALSPLVRSTVGGRPVLNLTFALNYALGGLNVWGYHAFNLLIHALAGLTLFGVVRRTLLRLDLSRCGRGALTPREREIPRCTRNDNLCGEGTPPTTRSTCKQ